MNTNHLDFLHCVKLWFILLTHLKKETCGHEQQQPNKSEKLELFPVTNYHSNISMGLSLVKAFIRDESLLVESQGNDTEDHCKRCLSYLLRN